jgi:two-component system, response regulator PdtaR
MVPNSLTTGETPEPDPIILVVEDDVLIRAATAQYLRGSGFDVLEAVNVDEAVKILQVNKDVRVVFTDVRLPGARSGIDLLEIVQRDFPHAKVLFTSGIVRADELADKDITFIRKPYFLFEVERHIKALLSKREPS